MSELVDKVIQRIAVMVAEDLVETRGKRVGPIVTNLHVTELIEGVNEVGTGKIADLALAYLKAADVSVHIPYHRIKEDGTLLTHAELREQMKEKGMEF